MGEIKADDLYQCRLRMQLTGRETRRNNVLKNLSFLFAKHLPR